MMLSVVICTYRRQDILRRTLRSLAGCPRPAGLEWEVLLVDNSPGHEGEAVSAEFASQLSIRYVCEPAPGVSNARNCGVSESRGELIWFLDDDVQLVSGWLESIARAAAAHPYAAFFLGKITPDWAGASPPAWVNTARTGPESQVGTYLYMDLGGDDRPLTPADPLITANLGVRREVFRKVGGFRPDLCPVGRRHRLGGDTEFGERANAAGLRGVYLAGAAVDHYTPPERARVGFVLGWSYWRGRASQRIKAIRHARSGQYGFGFRPREIVANGLRLIPESLAALLAAPFCGAKRRVGFWMRFTYRLGRLAESLSGRPDLSLDRPATLRLDAGK